MHCLGHCEEQLVLACWSCCTQTYTQQLVYMTELSVPYVWTSSVEDRSGAFTFQGLQVNWSISKTS